jgi:hypothetical protein
MNHPKRTATRQLRPTTATSEHPIVLEISRGQTRNPLRPVKNNRFMIGAAACCDLRLGGTEMPPLHSILLVGDSGLWIDAVAESPALLVNGRRQKSCEVNAGDEIEIGGIGLILHRTGVSESIIGIESAGDDAIGQSAQILRLAENDDHELDVENFSGAPALNKLEELSAAELIDLLEAEEALVEEFESRREFGAAALLHALSDRSDEVSDVETTSQSETPQTLLRELRSAITSLNEYSEGFETQTGRLSRFELERAKLRLIDFQQQIVGRLDDVLEKIADLQANDDHFEGHERRHVA